MGIKGYKGFNKDMTCRGMQYEEGKTYKMEEKPSCCNHGYHFCENPIDCLGYYSPNNSVYHEVEAIGDIDKDKDTSDSKIATNKIKIGARIDFQTIVKMAIEFTYKHCTRKGKGNNKRSDKSVASNTGDNSVASNTGDNSVAKNIGEKSISSCLGIAGQVAGKKGTWLVVAEWIQDEDWNWEVKEVRTIKVDGEKIKEDTYYALKNGKFVEKGSALDDNN